MGELLKYGVSTTIYFPLIERNGTDFEVSPATFEDGDAQIKKDGDSFNNSTENPSHVGNGIYALNLTATEMQAAKIFLTIIDQTVTKVWEDQAVNLSTYGNANAQHDFATETKQDIIDTNVDAIQTQTDQLNFTGADVKATLDGETVDLSSTGLDNIPVTEPSGRATTFRQMIVQTWMRFFNKVDRTTTQIRTYDDTGNIITTQNHSETGGTEKVEKS